SASARRCARTTCPRHWRHSTPHTRPESANPESHLNGDGPVVCAGQRLGNSKVRKRNSSSANVRRHIMTVAGIISAIIVGLIIGALGRLVVPGRQDLPIWLTIIVGIIAALVGTAIAQAVGVAVTDGIDWIELVFQIGLAAIGVAVVAGVRGPE